MLRPAANRSSFRRTHRASRIFAHAGMGARARRGGAGSRRVDGVRGGERQPEARAAADSKENPGRGWRLPEPGAELERRGLRLGLEHRRPARQREHEWQRCAGEGEAARWQQGDRGFRRLRPQPGGDLERCGVRLGQELRRRARQRGQHGQRPAREGEPARGHEGDSRSRRLRAWPGADLDRRGVRLGLQQLRPARRRQHGKQQCAGERESAGGHDGDRDRGRLVAQPGTDLDRHGARLGLQRAGRARRRQQGKTAMCR